MGGFIKTFLCARLKKSGDVAPFVATTIQSFSCQGNTSFHELPQSDSASQITVLCCTVLCCIILEYCAVRAYDSRL